VVRVISFFFKSSWKRILIASLASCLAAGLNILSIKYLSDIITIEGINLTNQIVFISLFVSVSVLITILVGKSITAHFEHKVADYRTELTNKILSTDYQNVEKKVDRLVPVLMFEVGTVGGFGVFIPEALVAVFQIIAVMIYLFALSWQLTCFTFLLVILLIFTNAITLSSFKTTEADLSKSRFRLHYILDRMEKGLKDLFVNKGHAKAYIEDSINPPSRESARHSLKLFTTKLKIDGLINLISLISFAIILVYAITSLELTQGELIEYLALLLFVRPAINRISNFSKQAKNVENALEQIEKFNVDIRDLQQFRTVQKEDQNLNEDESLIRLEEVTFRYEEESNFNIGPITLEIFSNEVLMINGGNGSGKSTLFKLIVGLYQPVSGLLNFKGQQVSETTVDEFRSNFSCYFTDSPVFDDLGFIKSESVLTKAKELVKELEIEDKTSVSEGLTIQDTNLSHGQRGRLNLLRMLLEDKSIYFFDEWAANQDVHFKEKFYKEIIPSLKKEGKTIVLISHDDKYYDIADRIVTLRNGQIDKVSSTS